MGVNDCTGRGARTLAGVDNGDELGMGDGAEVEAGNRCVLGPDIGLGTSCISSSSSTLNTGGATIFLDPPCFK
jgi:hypothetical protein